MAYANKTYVAFDGDNDIRYYRLMQAWRKTDGSQFNFYDAHDLNNLMPFSSEETIKRRLSERFQNSKMLIVLVGNNTKYLYKFVRWEIEQALKIGLPIVAVNLNGKRQIDHSFCPPILKNELVLHISYNKSVVRKAMQIWPESSKKHSMQGQGGPYYFEPQVYQSLGL